MAKTKLREENLLNVDLDFEEFDKIVVKQKDTTIVGINEDPEEDLALDSIDVSVDLDDIVDSALDNIDEEPEDDEDIFLSVEDEVINEKAVITKGKGKSFIQMYENKKNKKPHRLVESLLQNNVDTITDVIKATLRAAGISDAESMIMIGLIFQKMYSAGDNEIEAPNYLSATLGEIIDNEDIIKTVQKEIEDILEGKLEPQTAGIVTEPMVTQVGGSDNDGNEKLVTVTENPITDDLTITTTTIKHEG